LAWFAVSLAWRGARFKKAFVAMGLATAILFFVSPRNWNQARISAGSYAYFNAGWKNARVLYLKEDVQGGLTSVSLADGHHVLLSNGKFQGDDGAERITQEEFALMPVLFTHRFERALVIGLGTGNTLRTVTLFPFRHIDAAELSPNIVEAARLWFSDVNGAVFDRDPRVTVTIADGRNFLLLSNVRYDTITIEISSIWISGQADLYNREFYELCRHHLADGGVLQQWVAIHHLRLTDLLVILNTAARVFPHVSFFLGPVHGLLVASASPLECDYAQLLRLGNEPRVRQDLSALGIPALSALLGDLVLYDASFHQALGQPSGASELAADRVSSDLNPDLEYGTPRGLTLTYDTTATNRAFLMGFRARDLPSGLVIRNLPSENERRLILGYVAEARGENVRAMELFKGVEGPSKKEAVAEIARIASSDGRNLATENPTRAGRP
jgi:spermidine synthase